MVMSLGCDNISGLLLLALLVLLNWPGLLIGEGQGLYGSDTSALKELVMEGALDVNKMYEQYTPIEADLSKHERRPITALPGLIPWSPTQAPNPGTPLEKFPVFARAEEAFPLLGKPVRFIVDVQKYFLGEFDRVAFLADPSKGIPPFSGRLFDVPIIKEPLYLVDYKYCDDVIWNYFNHSEHNNSWTLHDVDFQQMIVSLPEEELLSDQEPPVLNVMLINVELPDCRRLEIEGILVFNREAEMYFLSWAVKGIEGHGYLHEIDDDEE